MKPAEALQPETPRTLEENVELANVTRLRQDLLPIIERLEADPALRFLILKHGKPQAVLMSVQTYELMKKLLNQVQEQMASLTREERVESAVSRLRSERSAPPAANSVDVKRPALQQLDAVLTILQQLKHDLHQNETAQADVVK